MEKLADRPLIGGPAPPARPRPASRSSGARMAGHLEPAAVDRRQPVERPPGHFGQEDREPVAAEGGLVGRPEPQDRLPHDPQSGRRDRRAIGRPTARRSARARPAWYVSLGRDRHAVAGAVHAVTGSSGWIVAPRARATSRWASTQSSTYRNPASRSSTPTKPSSNRNCGNRVRRSTGESRSTARPCSRAAARTPVTTSPSGGPMPRQATLGQQVPAGPLFQVVPPLERPADQRHVVRVLVIRPANDPGVAVRAAPVVDERELFEGQDRPPAAGQLERRRRPHPAGPDDDDVKGGLSHNVRHSTRSAIFFRRSTAMSTRPLALLALFVTALPAMAQPKEVLKGPRLPASVTANRDVGVRHPRAAET